MRELIFDLQRFVSNRNSNSLVSGTSDNDYIENYGSLVTIDGGAGSDSIDNYGNSVRADGGGDNDTLFNGRYFERERGGSEVSLLGGSGNDTIISHGSNSFLDGGDDGDLIYNGYRYYERYHSFYTSDNENYNGNNSTILGGTGNDNVKNHGDNVTIDAGAGNDFIANGRGGIEGGGSNVTINGGDDNDIISNYGKNVTINGGSGNDSIDNNANKVTINAGTGDDSICSDGDSVTIDTGADDDYIKNYYGNECTINAGAGNDSIVNSGDNVTIDGGDGNDSIENYGDNVTIDGGDGNDSIENYGDNVTIDGGDGNDSIENYGDNVTIDGGDGNDSIENYGDNVTIDGGDGNDSIENYGENVLVLVNGGHNTINGNVTVNMGADNSTLTGDRSAQVYEYVGGNDVITNYSYEDTIEIKSGKLDSYSFDGGDLIFHIGDGSIRLKNMTNHAITVKDSSGKTTTQIYGNGYSQQQVIKNFVKSMVNTTLSTREKLDEAIKLCSGFNSLQEVIDKMVSDCKKANDAEIFLRDYCGIVNDNDDTGSAVGWDVGGLSAKTHDDLMPEIIEGVYPDSTTFTKRGLTITVPDKDTLNEQEQLVIQGLYSWWMENSLKLIEESYGLSFKDKPYSIPFKFEYKPGDFGWAWGGPSVSVNMSYTNFEESDKTGGGLDGALVHEFTHVMQCNFNVWSYMPNYMTEGMANLTGGGDTYTNIAGNADSLAAYLDVDNTFSEDGNVYTVGYMFWRYLMKQASDSYNSSKSYAWKDSSSIVGTSNAEFLTGSGKGVSISAGAGNDTITAYGEKMKVFGEDGDDTIGNKGAKTTIAGGTGNDTIHNWSSNVSISGGEGNDIIYTTGENVTLKGGAGKRSMSIGNSNGGDSGENATVSGGAGDDVIYSFGYYKHENNSLTLASKKKVLLIGDDGNDYINNDYSEDATIEGGNGNDTIDNSSDKASISGGIGNDSIYNYSAASCTIDAGAGNDYIYNDDASNETSIIGDAGNDTIKNYASKVTINGGDGADTVYNYSASKVTIDGEGGNDSINNSGSLSAINGGDGDDTIYNSWDSDSVTINGGAGNDSIYNYSSSNVIIDGGAGNDSIYNSAASLVAIEGGSGNDSIYNSSYNVTINGGTGDDSIDNYGSSLKADGGGDNDILINGRYWKSERGGSEVSLLGGSGNDTIISHGSNSLLDGGNDRDLIYNGYRYYEPYNYFYDSDDENYNGNNSTILGGAGNDTINNRGNNVTIDAGTGNDLISLSFDATNDVIKYKYGDGNDTIEGFNETSTLSISGGNYTASASGNDVILKVGDGSITLTKAKGKVLNINGKKAFKKGWTLNDKTAVYGTSIETLITVNGVKSLDGIELNGTTVTVSKAALGTDNVTINNGYILALGSDVTKPATSKAWSRSKDVATYKQTTTAGYTLADNAINYTKKSVKTLATVKGVKDVSGLKISGTTITVSAASLNKKKITVSDGYTLNLGSDVKKSSTSKAWSRNKDVATYKQTTTEGYTLADNTINYSKKSVKTLATVTGVKAVSGLKISGKTITVSAASLNKKKVTVSDGYTLKLGSDVKKSSTKKAAWSLNNSTAVYVDASNTAGYSLAGDKKSIAYSKAKTGKTLAKIVGVKTLKGISLKEKVVTIKPSSLADKVSVSGGYEFDFAAGSYKGKSISGSKKADIITSRGKNLSVDSGAGNDTIKILGSATTVTGGKGNDTMTSSGKNNLFFYADGDGKDVIADFSAKDKIRITKGTAKVKTSGNDVIVKVGKGSIKLAGAAGQDISVISAKGTEKIYKTTAPSYALAYWFDEDDNNFNANQLDSIVKKSSDAYSVGKLETLTDLTAENHIIAYSGKK